ncbi:MAG TPA: molybdopterin-dependent oxidoreductase, partial [Alphaproteobacteria bacterium]|nr:molybdopterin-dependent oxidoreductase [Alphaproteobacteria bacterium]
SYRHLGNNPLALDDLAQGRHAFNAVLKNAKNPMLILGAGALMRKDGASIHFRARQIAENNGMIRDGWNGFNVLQLAAGRTGALDVGFVPAAGGKALSDIVQGVQAGQIGFVYLLGADEVDLGKPGRAFVVYQGHHGDKGAERADVVLPGAAYTEKSALYVNTEGRVQAARRAVFPPGEAREDWKILRALSEVLGKPLPFDNLPQLRQKLAEAHPHLARMDEKPNAPWAAFGRDGVVDATPFVSPIRNFYQTDVISRLSPTMAACVREILMPSQEAAE